MHTSKHIILSITVLIFLTLIFLFCTDPAKPDFGTCATLTDKQIQAQGNPVLDSLFFMYISAEGSDPISYHWFKDSVVIPGVNDDTLTFTVLSLSDTGEYICIVSNEYGSDTTFVYTLNVFAPPAITTPDKAILTHPASAVLDSSFLMYITASGSDTLIYQWFKNDTALINNNDTLLISQLAMPDIGNYKCIVSNSYGSDTSALYSLQLFTPPTITTPNKRIQTSVTVPELDSAFVMYITATGSDTLKYQWNLNSSPIPAAVNDTLSFAALAHADTGVYQCIVTNNWGFDSSLTYTLSFTGNHPPKWKNDTLFDIAKEMVLYQIILSDSCSDPDSGDIITFTLGAGSPVGDTITSSRIYTYTPTFNDAGIYHVNLWAKDGIDSSLAVLKLTVIDSNRAPEFKDSLPLDLYRIQEGEQLLIRFEAEDPDGDTAIVFLYTTTLLRPETIVFTDSQLVWQSSNTDSGAFSVVLGATDNVNTNLFNITVTVNDVNLPPEIEITGYQSGDIVQITEGIQLAFTVTVTDPDAGQTPVLTSPKNIPTGAAFDTASGSFSYTPDFTVSNKQSNTTFSNGTFYATDNMANRAVDSFVIHITVLDSNRTPVCIDTSFTVNEEITTAVNIFAVDPDGDSLFWSITQGPQHGRVDKTNGSIDTGVECSYTAFNLLGTDIDTLRITVEDGIATRQILMIITINADNDRPVITQAPPVSAVEDNTNAYSINIAGYDPESTTVRWFIDRIPKKGTLDKLYGDVIAGIEMLYTLKPDSCGKDTITFYLLDVQNISSDTQAIIITIDSVNDVPVINSQNPVSCDEDNNLTLQLSHLNIIDIDNNVSTDLGLLVYDSTNYSVVSGTTIKPDTNYFGPIAVKVRVHDKEDTTGIFVMNVTVNPVNDKPLITITAMPRSIYCGGTATISTEFSDVENGIDSIFFIMDSDLVDLADVSDSITYTCRWTPVYGPRVIGSYDVIAIIKDTEGARDTATGSAIDVLGTLVSDTLSVRTILDLNGHSDVLVSDVTTQTENRITELRTELLIWPNPPQPLVMDTLSDDLGNLANLINLVLKCDVNSALSSLPPNIGNLANLEYIRFDGSEISSLPKEIGTLSSLKRIDFYRINITNLPQEIANLTNLTRLWFQYCDIATLPSGIGYISSLNCLTASDNGQMTVLPTEIGNLTNLDSLSLNRNKLQSLPAGIGNLIKIKLLSLYDNELQILPNTVINLHNVSYLDISQNFLEVSSQDDWALWADPLDTDWRTTQKAK